ncbi:hypothetical protein VP01_90g1 [Puccinia sorghi]|uniref:DDE Tnp4 domain-containing protein n=1 Tax=Puccinia sorghi TaxID=27349 RepID=A0A0L6U7L7_9BASI|nr:hypothetical protein VP01_90g1 [Puccinia sorghi]
MCQNPSQHKQNSDLQLGDSPLDFTHNMIFLPSKISCSQTQESIPIWIEQSTCTLHKSCKKKAFLALLVLWMGKQFHLVKIPPKMTITNLITRRGQVFTTSLIPFYVFSNMHISQKPEKFFDQNKFLMTDSAYTSDWIEHSIGILKVQFSSLHEMRTQITIHKEMKVTSKSIISCFFFIIFRCGNPVFHLHYSSKPSRTQKITQRTPESGSEAQVIPGYPLAAWLNPHWISRNSTFTILWDK